MKRKVPLYLNLVTLDWGLLALVVVLVFLGVIFVYDASAVRADAVFGGKYYFLILQTIWALAGFVVLLLVSIVDYRYWVFLSRKLVLITFFLLILTLLPKVFPSMSFFIPKVNNSHRWIFLNPKPLPLIPILGRFGFQPSELAKISSVFYLSGVFFGKRKGWIFLKAMGVLLTLCGLVLLEPDFGTALILFLTGMVIFLTSGVSTRQIFLAIFGIGILGTFFIFSSPYRRERMLSYLAPRTEDSLSSRYQINQIMIALGSGGFWGVGLGQSRQKYGYIPEVNTDSIFAVIAEETGLIGSTFILVLFLALVLKGFSLSFKAEDPVAERLAAGIIAFISIQTVINFSGMTHLLPLTGVPLPLVSYGGSSLLVTMFSLGVLLNISRFALRSSLKVNGKRKSLI